MSTITKSVDVDVDVTTAYNQWTQFESFPNFMEGVEEVRQLDDTHTHWKIKVAGTTREFDARITEQNPDERIAWSAEDGPSMPGSSLSTVSMTPTPGSRLKWISTQAGSSRTSPTSSVSWTSA